MFAWIQKFIFNNKCINPNIFLEDFVAKFNITIIKTLNQNKIFGKKKKIS